MRSSFFLKFRVLLTLSIGASLLTVSAVLISSYVYKYSNYWPRFIYHTLFPTSLLVLLFIYLLRFYVNHFITTEYQNLEDFEIIQDNKKNIELIDDEPLLDYELV